MITSYIQAGARYVPTLLEIITALGLPAPDICLDAGDINSWDGTGIRWRDVSGNNRHFFRGRDSSGGSPGDDEAPLFNGTPGGRSENEFFGPSVTNNNALFVAEFPAVFVPLHKDNNLFTISTIWKNPVTAGTFPELWGNMSGGPANGIALSVHNASRVIDFTSDPAAGGGGPVIKASAANVALNAIGIHTVASDEAGGAGRHKVNQNAIQNFVPSVSTNTNAPNRDFSLAHSFGTIGTSGMLTDMRYYGFVLWLSRLSDTNIDLFNKYVKELRFPSAP